MKIKEHSSTKLSMSESAGCMWLFGFFFIAVAGTFVIGLSGAFINLHEINELEQLAAWIVSIAGIAAGVWIIYKHPYVYASFDKSTNAAAIERAGLTGKETETYKLSEIKDVVLNETIDSDGDHFYRIALKLNTDKQVILFSTGLHDKERQQENADVIKSFLADN